MPTLEWIGKNKVVNHHLEVPFCTLEKKYDFGDDASRIVQTTQNTTKQDASSPNMIIHGDNLLALKSLLPQYAGKVKCIYIDPPYNTGNENWVYNDNVNDPKIKKWLGQVVGTEEVDLTRHDKWLCMMYPRLKLLQKLLSDDGAIFISIDDNEQANLKLICDEIFGSRNFVANVIWQKKTGASDASLIATITENIFVYAKNISNLSFTKNTESYDVKRYKYSDEFESERGKYYIDNLDRGGLQYSDSLNFGIECPDGSITFPNGRTDYVNDGWIWKWSKKKIEWAKENSFIEFRKTNKKNSGWSVCYKNYMNVDNENNPIIRAAPHKNLIQSILNTDASNEIKSIFGSKSFETPKPIELLQFFIKLASSPNSIILDSFAGSGTTAHAVLNLNKADGGNRRFILVEMQDYAESITAERVKRVITGYGEGTKKTEGTGGSFSFYELGQSLFIGDSLNEEISAEKIREYVYYTETKQPLQSKADEPYFMGTYLDNAYYFLYQKQEITTLNLDFLETIKTKASAYIIYADRCTLGEVLLKQYNITFKKIPRDITRL